MIAKRVVIKDDRIRSLERRHPWIFSRGIQSSDNCEDGDIVEVYSRKDRFLGMGYWQDGSIMVRILSFEKESIDLAFWMKRLSQGIELRKELGYPSSHTTAYRLIHGEGDQLSGLIIDIYDSIAVIQCHTIGIHRQLDLIAEALISLLGSHIKTIVSKSGNTLPHDYAQNHPDEVIHGTIDEAVILENGHQFIIDVEHGQKTGFFLDQRDNRALVGDFSEGKSVLNLYSYTGGFSIYALDQGAANVTSVDISAPAIEICDRNAAKSNNPNAHQGLVANVHEYLKTLEDDVYDIIVVDPPAFAKSTRKRHNAIQAYKRINAAAIRKVKKGGLIFTFSCSQVVDAPIFYNTIMSAAIEARRPCQVLKRLSQGADHPVSIYHPEGSYLKGLLLKVG